MQTTLQFSAPSGKLKCTILIMRCLSYVRLLLFTWNRWAEFYETHLEVRSQRPLPNLCCCFFFRVDRKTKIAARPLIGRDINDYSANAEQNSTKLDWNEISMSSTKFTGFFVRADHKIKKDDRPLICGDIFDFTATAEQNSNKLKVEWVFASR